MLAATYNHHVVHAENLVGTREPLSYGAAIYPDDEVEEDLVYREVRAAERAKELQEQAAASWGDDNPSRIAQARLRASSSGARAGVDDRTEQAAASSGIPGVQRGSSAALHGPIPPPSRKTLQILAGHRGPFLHPPAVVPSIAGTNSSRSHVSTLADGVVGQVLHGGAVYLAAGCTPSASVVAHQHPTQLLHQDQPQRGVGGEQRPTTTSTPALAPAPPCPPNTIGNLVQNNADHLIATQSSVSSFSSSYNSYSPSTSSYYKGTVAVSPPRHVVLPTSTSPALSLSQQQHAAGYPPGAPSGLLYHTCVAQPARPTGGCSPDEIRNGPRGPGSFDIDQQVEVKKIPQSLSQQSTAVVSQRFSSGGTSSPEDGTSVSEAALASPGDDNIVSYALAAAAQQFFGRSTSNARPPPAPGGVVPQQQKANQHQQRSEFESFLGPSMPRQATEVLPPAFNYAQLGALGLERWQKYCYSQTDLVLLERFRRLLRISEAAAQLEIVANKDHSGISIGLNGSGGEAAGGTSTTPTLEVRLQFYDEVIQHPYAHINGRGAPASGVIATNSPSIAGTASGSTSAGSYSYHINAQTTSTPPLVSTSRHQHNINASSRSHDEFSRLLLKMLKMLHLCEYPVSELATVLAKAAAYFQRFEVRARETGAAPMGRLEKANVVVMLCFVAHSYSQDECCPLRVWHHYLFNKYCNLKTLNQAVVRVLMLLRWNLRVEDVGERFQFMMGGRELVCRDYTRPFHS